MTTAFPNKYDTSNTIQYNRGEEVKRRYYIQKTIKIEHLEHNGIGRK